MIYKQGILTGYKHDWIDTYDKVKTPALVLGYSVLEVYKLNSDQ